MTSQHPNAHLQILLKDGGQCCQVLLTIGCCFLYAGLSILQRQAHCLRRWRCSEGRQVELRCTLRLHRISTMKAVQHGRPTAHLCALRATGMLIKQVVQGCVGVASSEVRRKV